MIPSVWVLPHVKMVRQCGSSLSFSKAVLVLMCLCAQSSPNYVYPATEHDNQGEDNTALDFHEQSSQVKNLKQLVETLDERTLENFPVQRDGHTELINIAEEIGNVDSAKFGFQLLGMDRVVRIDEIIHENRETAKSRILLEWLNGKSKNPATCGALINVLDKIGFSELANEMGTTCEVLKIMDAHWKPVSVKNYSRLLSENYKKDPVIDSEQWLPNRLRGRNVTFVPLELNEKGSNILLSDLLSDIQSSARVLFVGRPGVGKSTIVRHLSKTLVQTEQFYLVVRLHLGKRGKIDSLSTLLQAVADETFDSSDITTISNYVKKTVGEGVCFLLDGYDEYIKPANGYDYVTSLIKREKLAKSVVIVTSRPSAVEDIEAAFDKNVEIIGFGERGIQTYLEQLELSQTEYETIHQYFHTHPNVKQLCYLPLHLSMMVYITVVTIDTGTLLLVDTETALYTDFLYLTIKQYESVRHEQTVESLKECFDDRYTRTDLCFLLRTISKKAFEGVLNREQTFLSSLDGLPANKNVSGKIEALSLFKIETIYDKRGFELKKYYYSHPTFQEFLAAFHLATLPREDQLIYIQHFWMQEMYKFFFGLIGSELSQLRYNDKTVSETFVSFAQEYLATHLHQELYIMKVAHQSERDSQFISYLQAVGVITNSNSLHVFLHAYQLHDCWYIGYTMAQSPLYELVLDQLHISPQELALCLSFINNYFKHDPQILESVNVKKLTFGHSQYRNFPFNTYWTLFADEEDPVSTIEILEFLSTFQSELTHLELAFYCFEHSASVARLGETIKSFRKLRFLALSINISVIKKTLLESALRELTHLELWINNKQHDTPTIIEDMLDLKSLKQLQSLTLYFNLKNCVVDDNMAKLTGELEYLTRLENLSLFIVLYGGFRGEDATELFQGIEKAASVKNLALHLDFCHLRNATAKELAAGLRNLTMLKNLSLCIDFRSSHSGTQGSSGVIKLAKRLKALTELQYLDLTLRWKLQANDPIDEATITLADGLKHLHNLSILKLHLVQNGSCSEIASSFQFLTQLQELTLGWNRLRGKTDAVKLINGLKSLKQLRKLDMSWNTMKDDVMVPLVDALKCMDYLHTLDLSQNKIGDDGVRLLAKAIENKHLTQLQILNLSWNNFSEVGAKVLAGEVVKLTHLHTLDFGLKLRTYSARALIMMHKKMALEKAVQSRDDSDDIWYHFVISILVGGVTVLYIAFHLRQLLSSEADSNRAMPLKGISETLAQGIFSTSYAWKLERLRKRNLDGTGTVIVILDTAVDCNCLAFGQKNILYVDYPAAVKVFHPAFLQRNIPVVNCLPHMPVTSTEHGNVCAAVAVGSSYNSPPAVPSGVAPGAQLIVYRIAEGGYSYNEAVLQALDDLKMKIESGTQIDVVSISYDLNEDNEEEIHRKIKELTERCVVFVAAAGNRGEYQPHASIPACFDNVISVGACDRNGRRSKFNACGRIDVYAPGEDIPLPSTQDTFRGTSFATPAVCGLVSLLKQCANHVGPPASNHIHQVEILREIFQRHMITKSDDGQVDVFDPVGFFLHVIDNPNLLNEIVQEHLDFQHMEL